MAQDEPKYGWNQSFQLKVVALMVRDPMFLTTYGGVTHPTYFDFEVPAVLSEHIIHYFSLYRVAPTKDALDVILGDYFHRYQIPDEIKVKFSGAVHQIFTLDLADYEYIRNRVVEFGRRQAMKIALKSGVEKLKNNEDLQEIQREVENALLLGSGLQDFGYELFSNINGLPDYIHNMSMYQRSQKVATGYKTVDGHLFGGLGPGELGVIGGIPKKGKSICLVNLGHSGFLQGHKVFHFTLELKEQDLVMRYLMRLMGWTSADVRDHPVECATYLTALYSGLAQKGLNPRLYSKYYSPGSIGVAEMRSYMTHVCSMTGELPGLIVIDYPDLLSESRGRDGDDYRKLGYIYQDIIRLGDDFKCPIWAVSQIHRLPKGEAPHLLTIHHFADSYKKVMHADLLITHNQTEDEAKEKPQKCRWFLAGGRRGADNVVVPMILEKHKMRLVENVGFYGSDQLPT